MLKLYTKVVETLKFWILRCYQRTQFFLKFKSNIFKVLPRRLKNEHLANFPKN